MREYYIMSVFFRNFMTWNLLFQFGEHPILVEPILLARMNLYLNSIHLAENVCSIPMERPNCPHKGYSQMISAYVPRSFGVVLRLSEEELVKLNEQRRSEKWDHYLGMKAAIEIHVSTQKIKDPLTSE